MNNKITYHKEEDYLVPDLIFENSNKGYRIGKYGRLRLNYLKEHKRGLYTELLISGTLKQHLIDMDESTTNKVNKLIKQFAEQENVNENFKEHHQME